MARLLVFFCVLIFQPFSCYSESVSVIIPCHSKHVYLLSEVLEHVACQTKIPDEVIISISDFIHVDQELLVKLYEREYPFEVKFIYHDKIKYAGENRNSGCELAKGDILIMQDADDLPYPQRIEAIVYAFNKTNAVHLFHGYTWKMEENRFDIESLQIIKITKWNQLNTLITNGNIAIRKNVFKQLKWSNQSKGEDVEYNKRVIAKFGNSIVLKANLLVYRNHLSSWNK